MEIALGLAHGVLPEVEDRRHQYGVRLALAHAVGEMGERARATGGDHRDADGLRYRARQLQVVASARAVPVHAREQDLAGPERLDLAGPLERIAARGSPAAVRVDAPAQGAFPAFLGRRSFPSH